MTQPITEQGEQDQIAFELGLPLIGGPASDALTTQMMQALRGRLAYMWARRQNKAFAAGLQYLYVKRDCADLLLGQLRMKKDAMLGRVLRLTLSQLFKNMEAIRKDIQAELERVEAQAIGGQRPVTAPLIHTAPIMVGEIPPPLAPGQPSIPLTYPDPNDPAYGGSPITTTTPDPYR